MNRLVRWAVMTLVLAVCLGGARVKEAAVEEQQQHGGGERDSLVRSRIREITSLVTNLMQGFMSRSSHDKPDSGLKALVEEELEKEILEDLDISMDGERELSHTYGKGRAEDTLITEDTPTTSKENLPNDALPSRDSNVLNEALSDAEESPRSKGVIDSDKRSTPSERLNDHLLYDVSADPSLPSLRKDDTIGSCSESGPLPVTPELSDDANMETKTSVAMDSSEDKASGGINIADAVNGGGEAIEDEIFNTDTAGDSEEAFNSISGDSEAMPSDSTSDENTDMDSDSEGDFMEGDDEYDSDDDYGLNLSDLSDTDDSSDNEMLYMNEVEHSNMGYASSSDEYDSNASSDEEGEEDEGEGEGQEDEDEDEHEDEEEKEEEEEEEEDKLPANVGFEVEGEAEGEAKVWNGEQDDSKVVIQSQFTHA